MNSLAARIAVASSRVRPLTSGTGLVFGPLPTTIVITLVMADVELAGGLVASTRSFCSGVDADSDCWNLAKPASLSLFTHSA